MILWRKKPLTAILGFAVALSAANALPAQSSSQYEAAGAAVAFVNYGLLYRDKNAIFDAVAVLARLDLSGTGATPVTGRRFLTVKVTVERERNRPNHTECLEYGPSAPEEVDMTQTGSHLVLNHCDWVSLILGNRQTMPLEIMAFHVDQRGIPVSLVNQPSNGVVPTKLLPVNTLEEVAFTFLADGSSTKNLRLIVIAFDPTLARREMTEAIVIHARTSNFGESR